ncbi:MAG: UPF0175 family protein [Candidatus Latescibacterota bacterium]
MTHNLSIEHGDDVLLSAAMSKEESGAEARFLLAAKLYEVGKPTSGQAGRVFGRGRVDFLLGLHRVGVSLANLGTEDAEVEAGVRRSAGRMGLTSHLTEPSADLRRGRRRAPDSSGPGTGAGTTCCASPCTTPRGAPSTWAWTCRTSTTLATSATRAAWTCPANGEWKMR